jgi:carbonic anhydrase
MAADTLAQRTTAARKAYFERYRDRFARLVTQDQSPEILYIGCNDSRVVPEAILGGGGPGELLVLRTVANAVAPYGSGQRTPGATIELAIHLFKVADIVVCGHTHCGGLRALDGPVSLSEDPDLALWLEYVRPAQTRVDALMPGADPLVRHRAIAEENVLLQLDNLQTYPAVRDAVKAERVRLHGWVYDLETGAVSYWDDDLKRFVAE